MQMWMLYKRFNWFIILITSIMTAADMWMLLMFNIAMMSMTLWLATSNLAQMPWQVHRIIFFELTSFAYLDFQILLFVFLDDNMEKFPKDVKLRILKYNLVILDFDYAILFVQT